ncbi:MAG TPA: GNAT family N-acetyltransferase [Microbacterium sp.]|nr:GNAT family N-acetyltransferase [Microbacterium sp.]
MARSRIRVTLEESDDAGAVVDALEASAVFAAPWGRDHRLWLVRADGEEAGFVEAAHAEERVDLAFFVAESWRGRGIASASLGRFLGLRAWPDAEILRAAIDPSDAAAAAVLRSAGFASSDVDGAGLDVWERGAPRAKRPRTGPERFVTEDGRIDRWPVQAEDRLELLKWVADRALVPGQVLSEREINARLSAFTGDVALLRRLLVDHGVLERTRSGSEYALAR